MKNVLLILLAVWLASFVSKKDKTSFDDETKKFYKWNEFNMGVDLSYVNQIEDYGGVYRDSNQVRDCLKILKDHGANTVRIRLWHTPAWVGNLNGGKLYYDLYGVEKMIRRAKEAGLAVNLDIHYSDTWADPQKQETPKAWKDLSLDVLKDSVYKYTLAVLNYYKSKNLVPEMVQVGNETTMECAGLLEKL